jgi:hypothetical protein
VTEGQFQNEKKGLFMVTRASKGVFARLLGGTLILAIVLGVLAPAAQASPYAYVSVLGGLDGVNYSNVVAVSPTTTTIYYKLQVQFVNPPATNSSATTTATKTFSSLYYGKDGIGAVWFDLYQQATSNIQASLSTATLDVVKWGSPTSTGGTTTTAYRTGADVMNINPVAGLGQWWGVDSSNQPIPVIIGTGTANVLTLGSDLKADSLIKAGYNAPGTGVNNGVTAMVMSAKILGTASLASKNFQPSSVWTDPGVGFNDLVLYQPWAEAVIKDVPAGGFTVDLGEDPLATLTLNANAGGSSHTATTYHWTINSGAPLNIDTLVPTLTLTNNQLNDLMNDGPNHLITLAVGTADGKSATGSQIQLTLLPEPATMVLVAVGGLVVAIRRRRAQ